MKGLEDYWKDRLQKQQVGVKGLKGYWKYRQTPRTTSRSKGDDDITWKEKYRIKQVQKFSNVFGLLVLWAILKR